MIGGVLCARTVKDVLPELEENRNQLEKMISKGNDQLSKKGQEINKFIEVNNIKIKGQETMIDKPDPVPTDDGQANRNRILVTN